MDSMQDKHNREQQAKLQEIKQLRDKIDELNSEISRHIDRAHQYENEKKQHGNEVEHVRRQMEVVINDK